MRANKGERDTQGERHRERHTGRRHRERDTGIRHRERDREREDPWGSSGNSLECLGSGLFDPTQTHACTRTQTLQNTQTPTYIQTATHAGSG